MSLDHHLVEIKLVEKACLKAGGEQLHLNVLYEAAGYVRQISTQMLRYAELIAQHCHRTRYVARDIEHAFITLWEASEGVCTDINVLSFAPSPSEDVLSDDEDYEDENESVDSSVGDILSDNSDGSYLEGEQEDQYGNEMGYDASHDGDYDDDDDQISHLTSDDDHDDDISKIMEYLSSLGDENSLPFESREAADRYQSLMVEHLRLSLLSQPCLFSRLGLVPLGLLQNVYSIVLAEREKERAQTIRMQSSKADLQENVSSTLQEVLHSVGALPALPSPSQANTSASSIPSQQLQEVPSTHPLYSLPQGNTAVHYQPDRETIQSLRQQLSQANEKIRQLTKQLSDEKLKNELMHVKDRKIREVVQVLSNIAQLDEEGVRVVREISSELRRESGMGLWEGYGGLDLAEDFDVGGNGDDDASELDESGEGVVEGGVDNDILEEREESIEEGDDQGENESFVNRFLVRQGEYWDEDRADDSTKAEEITGDYGGHAQTTETRTDTVGREDQQGKIVGGGQGQGKKRKARMTFHDFVEDDASRKQRRRL
eukprot:gene24461-29564_t